MSFEQEQVMEVVFTETSILNWMSSFIVFMFHDENSATFDYCLSHLLSITSAYQLIKFKLAVLYPC